MGGECGLDVHQRRSVSKDHIAVDALGVAKGILNYGLQDYTGGVQTVPRF
jgi:hypothetical protein